MHVTGYWARESRAEGDQRPADFIAAGPPPVYLGFGSMPDRDPAALAGLMPAGLRGAGQRALLLSGWSGLRPGGRSHGGGAVLSDQFFWGRRVQKLGAGPAPIPREKPTAQALSNALGEAGRYRTGAQRVGFDLFTEDGVKTAIAVLEQLG